METKLIVNSATTTIKGDFVKFVLEFHTHFDYSFFIDSTALVFKKIISFTGSY